MGELMVGLRGLWKPAVVMALIAVSTVANAITVQLVKHNQTSDSGSISTLITDGSHVQGQPASTAVFDWDGTTLSSTGLYSAVSSLGSSPYSPTVLNDRITDLSINTGTGTATATAYECVEGTFLAGVGANGCGDYTLGVNFTDESTTVWTGLTVSQTIGGDDVAGTEGPRLISAYDFGSVSLIGTGNATGDLVEIGNGQPLGVALLGGELMTFEVRSQAVDDTADGRQNQTINIPILANDALVGDITALTTTAQSPATGTIVVNGVPGPQSGVSIDFVSDLGFTGPVTFDYTITDTGDAGSSYANGDPYAQVTDTATVTVTINDGPVAQDDGSPTTPFATVNTGATVSLDVLANDAGLSDTPLNVSSPFADPAALGTPTVTGTPGDASSIRIQYVAGATPGDDVFDYQISDASAKTASATVYVKVVSPVVLTATDDAVTVFSVPVHTGGADDFTFLTTLLANDVGTVNTPFSVTIATAPANGIIGSVQGCATKTGSCQVSYRPDAGFIGTDSFEYTLTDRLGAQSTASVTITVNEVPVAVDDTASTAVGTPVTINVLANDTGLSFTPLNVTILGLLANGTVGAVAVQPDNTILYTPATGSSVTTDTFDYRVTDANGKTSMARVTVTINLGQAGLPGSGSSAVGPIGLVLLALLAGLRRRRQNLG